MKISIETFLNRRKSEPDNSNRDFPWTDVLGQSVPVLMGAFIFLNPIPRITTIKEIIFYPTVFIVLLLLRFKKIEFSFKTPMTLPFVLFGLWSFLNLFFALDKPNSIHDFLAHFLKYVAFYYIVINCFNSRKRVDDISWLVIISTVIFSIASLVYFYIILKNPLSIRFGSERVATNIIGFGSNFAIILSLYHFYREKLFYRKMILFFGFFPLLAISALTQARGTWLALIAGIFIFLIQHKKALIIFVCILPLVLLNKPVKSRIADKESYLVRVGLIFYSIEMIKDYPIIGSGFSIDTYRDPKLFNPEEYVSRIPEKLRKQPHGFYWPHNMLLSMGVRVGLVGLALFLYLLFVPAKMCWDIIKYAKDDAIKSWGFCLLSVYAMFCVKGLVDPVYTHFVDVIFYTLLAMITILWRLNEGDIRPVFRHPM